MLLTDGDNTQNRWTTSGSSIDARTALACTNVKAANIKIYTVRVIDGDANLLRNCATKTNMYYNVNQASQLNSVFSLDRAEPGEPAPREVTVAGRRASNIRAQPIHVSSGPGLRLTQSPVSATGLATLCPTACARRPDPACCR